MRASPVGLRAQTYGPVLPAMQQCQAATLAEASRAPGHGAKVWETCARIEDQPSIA
jgi:hypothetical protein